MKLTLSHEAPNPLTYLSRLLRQQDHQTRQIIQDRDAVHREYGHLFHPDRLDRLGAEDFKSFLLYENNRHWWGIHRQQATLVADMARLRRALAVLLDESRPIVERLDWIAPRVGEKKQPGLGPAVMTPILHVVYPDQYGVWNSIAQGAMTRLGMWPTFPRGSSFGVQYELLNNILKGIARSLVTDLWSLDALWWRVERDHEPIRHQFEGGNDSSQPRASSRAGAKPSGPRFTCSRCHLSKALSLRLATEPDLCVDCSDL